MEDIMRNFTVGGRSVGITERELDCFTGVSRGGILVVEVGAGPFDVKITSWSAIGFDCSPNREDLVSLLRKQLLSLIPINGRIQVGLTSDGKSIAQSMGSYSLAAMVRDVTPAPDRTEEPVVAEEPVYTEDDFADPEFDPPQLSLPPVVPISPEPEPAPTPDPSLVTEPGGEAFRLPEDPSSEPPPAMTDEKTGQLADDVAGFEPEPLPPRVAAGPDAPPDPEASATCDQCNALPCECVTEPEPESEPAPQPVPYDPIPEKGAKLLVLQAYAVKYDIDTTGMRSKVAVREAIEARVLGQ